MVIINKIYTRTGDHGSTGLVGGSRIEKSSLRIGLVGEVDELNAWIGSARTLCSDQARQTISSQLEKIQQTLFDIGAELATPPELIGTSVRALGNEESSVLEEWIDQITSLLPELRSFVLPGGTPLNATLHISRVVCRRVERTFWSSQESLHLNLSIGQYLNRLSDLLFALARRESSLAGQAEYLWAAKK